MNREAIRILVVDDELGMREGCRKVLSVEGYDVETAEDGVAGIKVFKERGAFAAALLDLKMPRMGGIDLLHEIKKIDPDVVVLVITAHATIETAVEATKLGAYGYIPKPFTPDELLLPVKNGLERRALEMEARRLREEREKRLLEVAFERSKSNTIINCMTDGVMVVNRAKQIVLRNAAATRILPCVAALPLPAPVSDLACPQIGQLLIEALEAGPGPRIVAAETTIDESTYMVNVSPVVDPSGDTTGAVAVLRDITARKKLETAKSMFVSMVAHEIKSPLAAIEGYLNVLLTGAVKQDPAREQHMIERSIVRAKGLRTLVSDLMNLTAMETGHFTIKRVPTDVRKVLADAVDACNERAQQKCVQLHLDDGEPPQPVLADEEALQVVFTNLIDNAIKYTPEEGRVDVQVSPNGTSVKVAVRDTGIGIAPEDRDRVFEEFYRVKNHQTSKIPGTGLGLSLVKRLVDMHQGKISLRTAQGQGSTFSVSLPVA